MGRKKKLPTIGTSAATTAFCAAEVKGPGGSLWIDGNGKITRSNGTLAAPKPNAFSLVNKADCPGKTSVCTASCYVEGIRKHASDTFTLYEHNSAQIRKIFADRTGPYWAKILATWITRSAPGGFRWHVSGDIFSAEYARFIARVCRWSKDVPHWIYTRSFDFLPELAQVSTVNGGNLAINLSADRENYPLAKIAAEVNGAECKPLRICYLSDDGQVPSDLPEGSVVFPDYTFRGGTELGQKWFEDLPPNNKAMVCPVDYHGKDERRRCGPCAKCLT